MGGMTSELKLLLFSLAEGNKQVTLSSMSFCERCQNTYSSASALRRHRRQVHRENLPNLPRGPARLLRSAVARAGEARRDLRRRESQLPQRRLARAQMHGEQHSLEQFVAAYGEGGRGLLGGGFLGPLPS